MPSHVSRCLAYAIQCLLTLRGFRHAFVALAGVLLIPGVGFAQSFGMQDVERRARDLSKATYVKPDTNLPAELKQLKFEQYQNIRYKSDQMHWYGRGMPIELSFFHRGAMYDQAVKINEVSSDGVQEIRYRPEAFDFGPNKIDPAKLKGLGFAGFRVHFPVNAPKVKDEVLVFLGATYFRALGKDQVYGLSARGLAIDTAVLSGEEFPRFVEFWVVRPSLNAKEFTFYALLDSPRMTGAYRFILRPGEDTAVEVRAQLFPRDTVGKLGIAPLTSMFFFGENQRPGQEDYRPEVHDSDGLSVNVGNGEWLWRPLVNPKRLLVTSFTTASVGGFGLQQRDRDFSNYEELATRYDKRPSAWVEPMGKWGPGRVELVQIPTPDETNDNIVAYWVPDKSPGPGKPFELQYRIFWQKNNEQRPPMMWVAQTRRGPDHLHRIENSLTFAVDFVGTAPPPPANAEEGRIAVSSHLDNATMLQSRLERNEATDGWRFTMVVRRSDPAKPVEMRANLTRDNKSISETWSYILPPE